MTTNYTYGDLKNRIVDEMGGRSDLSTASSGLTLTPIEYAILDAVAFWETKRFWFNELRTATAFSTVNLQEFYTSSDWSEIPNLLEIDQITVTVSGARTKIERRTPLWIDEFSLTTTNTGVPTDYAYFQSKLRLYPIPNGVYAVNVMSTKKFTALSATSDSNVWTYEAEPLIRAEAKLRLYRDTLMDDQGSMRMQMAVDRAVAMLRGDSHRRVATNKFRATDF